MPTFEPGVPGSPTAAEWQAIIDAMMGRPTSGGATAWTVPGIGGVWRYGVLTQLEDAAASAFGQVLDNSMDWRDRLISVAVLREDGMTWPGGPEPSAGDWQGNPARAVGYTGTGESIAEATADTFHTELTFSGVDDIRIYANALDGALWLDVDGAYSGGPDSALILIWASEQVGADSTPVLYNGAATDAEDARSRGALGDVPLPLSGKLITPYQLNAPQDAALLAQFNEGDQDSISRAIPYGKIIGPRPALGEVYVLGTRDGEQERVDPVTNVATGRLYRRQRTADGRRLVTTALLSPYGGAILDRSIDWRDRFIYVVARDGEALDIRPGGADVTDFNGTAAGQGTIVQMGYLGGGEVTDYGSHTHYVQLDSGLRLFAANGTLATGTELAVDPQPGDLVIVHGSNLDRTIPMMVYASPQLGPLTPRS